MPTVGDVTDSELESNFDLKDSEVESEEEMRQWKVPWPLSVTKQHHGNIRSWQRRLNII